MAQTPSSPHTQKGRLRTYTLPGGWQVLIGRTDADNDFLSFEVARPEDWWFHVRGMPGSHAILQGPPGADPDRETLQRAAAIAAYHSKARDAGVVPVSGTRVRDVSKPRGRKPAPCRSGTNGCSRCARHVATWPGILAIPLPHLSRRERRGPAARPPEGRHPAGVEGWRPGALDRVRAAAAASCRRGQVRRRGRGLPWRREPAAGRGWPQSSPWSAKLKYTVLPSPLRRDKARYRRHVSSSPAFRTGLAVG